uniref:Uncharacterized protein n=1 Tax=Globodera rostochiensis TaxID=31243 RepID=A0A914HHE2_GLORO
MCTSSAMGMRHSIFADHSSRLPQTPIRLFVGPFPSFSANDNTNSSPGQAVGNWLVTPREDGVPKMFQCRFYSTGMDEFKENGRIEVSDQLNQLWNNTSKTAQQQQMKEIFICDDVWYGIFAFVHPIELGLKIALISDRLDVLVDGHFKSRKWSLGPLRIRRAIGGKGAEISKRSPKRLPIPQGPVPNSVIGFECIWINYVDKSVIEFLQRIRRLFESSGTDVSLATAGEQSSAWEIICQKIWPFVNDNICRFHLFECQFKRLRRFLPAILRNCPNLRSIYSHLHGPAFPAEDNANSSPAAWNEEKSADIRALILPIPVRGSPFPGLLIPENGDPRDPNPAERYRQANIFLADLNCEQLHCNSTYRDNMVKLRNFVLVQFSHDHKLVPKETALFGFFADNGTPTIIPMEQSAIYNEDRIGLKALNESNRLHLLSFNGEHLQIPTEVFVSEIIEPYLKDKSDDGLF